MTQQRLFEPEALVRARFAQANIPLASLDVRSYPEESIFVVKVEQRFVAAAIGVGNELDRELEANGFKGFVTVRPSEHTGLPSQAGSMKEGVRDPRATELTNILNARSRTSEIQPSLSYVPDAANSIAAVATTRHHLIFGRRGAGKTALMLETKRIVEGEGNKTIWLNAQTYRNESAEKAFAHLALSVCNEVLAHFRDASRMPDVVQRAVRLSARCEHVIMKPGAKPSDFHPLVPELHEVIRRFLGTVAVRLYIFVDEFHYLQIAEQPRFLDLVHGAVRDSDAWIKVAAIKHLARWFQPATGVGLQTGHDADHVELDVSLQAPARAKEFLETVLLKYASHVGIRTIAGIFSPEALDRLVLASGAVPRDYMVLGARAIRKAQLRDRSRTVGVQDVNNAAGEVAQLKLTELEEDAASSSGATQHILEALARVRAFCLDEQRCTFFRVDFKDKERLAKEYELLENLLSLRLIHLLNPTVSDRHKAGQRYEAYMLDLSEFSSDRLKKHLLALDFVSGGLVLKRTGTQEAMKRGDTPKKLLALLRRGSLFSLETLRLGAS